MVLSPALMKNKSYDESVDMANGTSETRFYEIKQQIQIAESRCDIVKNQLDYLKLFYTGVKSTESLQKEQKTHASKEFCHDINDTERVASTKSESLLNGESSTICLPNVASSAQLVTKKNCSNVATEYDDVCITNESLSLDITDDSNKDKGDKNIKFSPSQAGKSALENLRSKEKETILNPEVNIKASNRSTALLNKLIKSNNEHDEHIITTKTDKTTSNKLNEHFKNREKNKLQNDELLSSHYNQNGCTRIISHRSLTGQKLKDSTIKECINEENLKSLHKEENGRAEQHIQNNSKPENKTEDNVTFRSITKNERKNPAIEARDCNTKTSSKFNENKVEDKDYSHKMNKRKICSIRLIPKDDASVNTVATTPASTINFENEYNENLSVVSTTKKPKGREKKYPPKISKSEHGEKIRTLNQLNENKISNVHISSKRVLNTASQENVERTGNGELSSQKKQNKNTRETSTGKENIKTYSGGESTFTKKQTHSITEYKHELRRDKTTYLSDNAQSTLLNIPNGEANKSLPNSKVKAEDDIVIKATRRGTELHTISSKLKIVDRSYFRRFNFRSLPFIVAKATTPSHNLALNIQQTLSIIKMKQPIFNEFSITSDSNVNPQFISATNTEMGTKSMILTDQISMAPSRSSVSKIVPCAMQSSNSNLQCKNLHSQINGQTYQEWCSLNENNEGDADSNRCNCYPRNCINYHKILNQYLEGGEQLSYLSQSSRPQDKLSRQLSINVTSRDSTMSMRLTKVLRQVQMFQEILKT